MLEDRLRTIEEHIRTSRNIPESARAELLGQLASLEAEMKSAHLLEGDRSGPAEERERKPEVFESALHDLAASVEDLEASHPKIAAAVNRLALALSNMGI